MFDFFTNRRRRRLRQRGLTPDQERIVLDRVPVIHRLPPADRLELLEHAAVLLHEKHFEGAGGLEVTEEMRVTVAGWGALPLLHRDTAYYDRLVSIILYPGEFVAERVRRSEGWLVSEGDEVRAGESWHHGSIVLSWEDLKADVLDSSDGFNVALHEFAHQLDAEDGLENGAPLLDSPAAERSWAAAMEPAYLRLQRLVDAGRETFLDPYAAETPAEFFAVITEYFFELPADLLAEHPDLYRELSSYYRQDPASWPGGGTAATR